MKKFIFLTSFLLMSGTAFAQGYEIEAVEPEESEMCIPDEKCEEQACNRRRSRRSRRARRCGCVCRDKDAYWPGKMENSFMEEMMR